MCPSQLTCSPRSPFSPRSPCKDNVMTVTGLSPSPWTSCPRPHPMPPHTHLLTRSPGLPQLPSTARHPRDARLARLPRLPRGPLRTPLTHGTAHGALGAGGTHVPLVTFGSSLTREA